MRKGALSLSILFIIGCATPSTADRCPCPTSERAVEPAPKELAVQRIVQLRRYGFEMDIQNEEWDLRWDVLADGDDRPAALVLSNALLGARISIYVSQDQTQLLFSTIEKSRKTLAAKNARMSRVKSDYGSENYRRFTYDLDGPSGPVSGKVIVAQLVPKFTMMVTTVGEWPREVHDVMCRRMDLMVASMQLIEDQHGDAPKKSSW